MSAAFSLRAVAPEDGNPFERYPMANHLVEFMPATPEHAATAEYFERAGFWRWGEPERVEWSDVLWQEYVCDIRVPLLLGPAASGLAPS